MTTPTIATPNTNAAAKAALLDAAGGLGALVWWSLTDTRITPDRLRGILAAEGDDPSRVPDIEQMGAVRRATRGWAQGRGNATRYRAEVAQETGNTMTIGILRREKPAADEVRWVQVDQLVFDGAAGAWIASGSTSEAAAFRGEADEQRTHLDHDWIRPNILLRGLTAAQSVCLRDRGGVYYVPAQRQAELSRLSRIVAKIGRCHLDVVHAQATPESRSAIAGGASAALRDDLGALVERIHGWAESARKVSDTSADVVLSDLADLKAKADLYADALQVSMDDLTSAIDAAKAEAERILSGTITVKTEKAPPPVLVEALRSAIAVSEVLPDGSIMIAANTLRSVGLKCNLDRPPREGVATSGNHGYWTNALGSRVAAALGYSARLRGPALDAPLQLRPLAVKTSVVQGLPAVAQDLPVEPVQEIPAPVPDAPAEEPVMGEPESLVGEPEGEPEADLHVELDGEAEADMREALASKAPAELRDLYRRAVGEEPGKRSKAQMIEKILKIAA